MISSISLTSPFYSAFAFWNAHDVSSPTRLNMTCKKTQFLPVNPQSFAQFLCRLPIFSLFTLTISRPSFRFLLFPIFYHVSSIMFFIFYLYHGFYTFPVYFKCHYTSNAGNRRKRRKRRERWKVIWDYQFCFLLEKTLFSFAQYHFSAFLAFQLNQTGPNFCFHYLLSVIRIFKEEHSVAF